MRSFTTVVLCAGVSTGALCTSASAARFFVRANAPHGGLGSNWANAFQNPQQAFEAAKNLITPPNVVDEIIVAAGTYTPGTTRESSFVMYDKMRAYGGFLGTEPEGASNLLSLRSPYRNTTTLSGEIGAEGLADNCYHVVRIERYFVGTNPINIDDKTQLDGFRVTAGNASGGGSSNSDFGGGLLINVASPVVQNCLITGNSALIGGGGHAEGRGPMLDGTNQTDARFISCSISGNTSTTAAGGFCNRRGQTTMINCELANNVTAGGGGGVVSSGQNGTGVVKTITMINCTVAYNTAATDGGIANGGVLVVRNSIVHSNTGPPNLGSNTALTVTYSDIQGLAGLPVGGTYSNNLDVDPVFIGTNNVRLGCLSPLHDAGLLSLMVDDTYDVDNDSLIGGEKAPDRDRKPRVNNLIAMGAYETLPNTACPGDATGNGVIDVDDLLMVINAWSPMGCPIPCCQNCRADVFPTICAGDTLVNVDDLLRVINTWGACPLGSSDSGGLLPQNLQDCMDYCNSDPDYGTCMDACLDSLCKQGYSQFCD